MTVTQSEKRTGNEWQKAGTSYEMFVEKFEIIVLLEQFTELERYVKVGVFFSLSSHQRLACHLYLTLDTAREVKFA